jgi:dodecin
LVLLPMWQCSSVGKGPAKAVFRTSFVSAPRAVPQLIYTARAHFGANSFKEQSMSVAKIIEISAGSTKSFEDAAQVGVARAHETVKGITGAWIAEQKVVVDKGKVVEYRVTMKITFILDEPKPKSKK